MRILLDVCCAVCAISAIEKLEKDFLSSDLVLYLNDSNISPFEEYTRRKDAVLKIAHHYRKDLVIDDYNHASWLGAVVGLESEPEGGARCNVCYNFRLSKVANYAKRNGFDTFTSTLTSGPPKKASIINPIGESIATNLGIRFISDDFKKSGGQDRARIVAKDLGIYRQNYCGCEFSIWKK